MENAANNARKDSNDVVILQLDRPRILRFGHLALKRFSAMTGCSLSEIQDVVGHYDKMTLLIWCALNTDDPNLSMEQLDRELDKLPKVMPIFDQVAAALEAAFDDGHGDEETGEANPTDAGTGGTA